MEKSTGCSGQTSKCLANMVGRVVLVDFRIQSISGGVQGVVTGVVREMRIRCRIPSATMGAVPQFWALIGRRRAELFSCRIGRFGGHMTNQSTNLAS